MLISISKANNFFHRQEKESAIVMIIKNFFYAAGIFSRVAPESAGSSGKIQAARPALETLPVNTYVPEIRYKTIDVDGVNLFYREAGPKDGPAI